MDFKWKPMHQKEMKNRMMMEEGSNWIKMKLKNNNKKQGLRLLQNKNQKNKLLHQKLRRLKQLLLLKKNNKRKKQSLKKQHLQLLQHKKIRKKLRHQLSNKQKRLKKLKKKRIIDKLKINLTIIFSFFRGFGVLDVIQRMTPELLDTPTERIYLQI